MLVTVIIHFNDHQMTETQPEQLWECLKAQSDFHRVKKCNFLLKRILNNFISYEAHAKLMLRDEVLVRDAIVSLYLYLN